MANIQMEYRVYFCNLDQEKNCEQCFTQLHPILDARIFMMAKIKIGKNLGCHTVLAYMLLF